jgi:phage N-6-adenine-methyltransferase
MPNPTKFDAFLRPRQYNDDADDYATPRAFIAYWDRRLHFDRDVAAAPWNTKCRKFWTRESDALAQEWDQAAGPVFFMNPPFARPRGTAAAWGQSGLYPWVEKARISSIQHGVTVGALLPVWSGDLWFHKFCRKTEINFIRRRLTFVSPKSDGKDNQAGFESMFVVFRPDDTEIRVRFIDCPVKDL